MRVLVCGGRAYSDADRVYSVLDMLHCKNPITCIIEGGAKGADFLACRWSASRGVADHSRFSADWALYGKSAGPKRNQRMIDEGKPDMVVAFPGGSGTADMVKRAKTANIPIIEITGDKP